jgi:hypothetical protein
MNRHPLLPLIVTVIIVGAVGDRAAAQGKPARGRQPELKAGLDAMLNLDQLPLLFPNGTRTLTDGANNHSTPATQPPDTVIGDSSPQPPSRNTP